MYLKRIVFPIDPFLSYSQLWFRLKSIVVGFIWATKCNRMPCSDQRTINYSCVISFILACVLPAVKP